MSTKPMHTLSVNCDFRTATFSSSHDFIGHNHGYTVLNKVPGTVVRNP